MSQSNHDSPPEGGTARSKKRRSPRSRLPIPVRAKIGLAPTRESRLRDVSVSGFRLDWPDGPEPGELAVVRFAGYPGICPAFSLQGRVVRVIAESSPGVGIAIDREGSSPEALQQFRQLVLHYMRHRPLLDELGRDFFEGRCQECEWIGRVGVRTPVCPCCGERVRPIDTGQ